MLRKRIKNITCVLDTFEGRDGEPQNETERYLLRSMWVMMLAEFEGCIKSIIETHIDKAKKKT